ncbi:hypothetical protein C8Q74DRAFT_1229895 [Fomes fomentarius]|nr:hypothetical protein C8Q74DRAFT_1229895 [Fomes fomentarius]
MASSGRPVTHLRTMSHSTVFARLLVHVVLCTFILHSSLCSPARSRRQFSFLKRGPHRFLVSTCLLQPPFTYRPTRSIQGIPSYHGSPQPFSPPNTASSFSSQTHYLRTLCHDTLLQSLYSYPPSLLFPSLNHESLPMCPCSTHFSGLAHHVLLPSPIRVPSCMSAITLCAL